MNAIKMYAITNPANSDQYTIDSEKLLAACGYIPQFFYQAVHNIKEHNTLVEGYPKVLQELGLSREPEVRPELEELTVESIAKQMDEIYQFGGFQFPVEGTIDEQGILISPYEEDQDMYPLVRFFDPTHNFELFVYRSGIVGLRDSKNHDNVKMARFD
jgi:hypothetical protein